MIDYHGGPIKDANFKNNDIWLFSTTLEKCQIHIKLQVRDSEGGIISFHES